MGAPKGPSNAQIKSDAMVEEARVKFEAERRSFLERVASYDIAAQGQARIDGGSLEYVDPSFKDPNDFGLKGLSVPGKFDPALDFSKFSAGNKPDLSWATAPNLGYNPDWSSQLWRPAPPDYSSTTGAGGGRFLSSPAYIQQIGRRA